MLLNEGDPFRGFLCTFSSEHERLVVTTIEGFDQELAPLFSWNRLTSATVKVEVEVAEQLPVESGFGKSKGALFKISLAWSNHRELSNNVKFALFWHHTLLATAHEVGLCDDRTLVEHLSCVRLVHYESLHHGR